MTGRARVKETRLSSRTLANDGTRGQSRSAWRSLVRAAITFVTFVVITTLASTSFGALAQKKPGQRPQRNVSLTSHSRDSLSPEAREMVELASGVVCKERIKDPKGSVPIDDMQARPSLPVRSPEAVAGAERAQRLLPNAKSLVVTFAQTPG